MKQLVLFRRVFAGIGVVMAVGAAWYTVEQTRFLSKAVKVEGRVIDLAAENVYYPIFTYEYPEGRKHVIRSSTGSSPPSYSVGEIVQVNVDPSQPKSGEIAGFMNQWFPLLMMAGFSLIFGSIGFGMMAWSARKKRLREYLLRNGEKVAAEITEVDQDGSVSFNGRNPFRILAQFREGDKVHVFKSENLWFDPKPYLDREKVDVYCMPNRRREHWMDIRFLPDLKE